MLLAANNHATLYVFSNEVLKTAEYWNVQDKMFINGTYLECSPEQRWEPSLLGKTKMTLMPEGVFKTKTGNSASSCESYNELHILTTNIEEIFLPGIISANSKKMKK